MTSQEIKIYPQKVRFLIAFCIDTYSVVIPALIAIALITHRNPDSSILWFLPAVTLLLCLMTYPYYILSTNGVTINGPTRWGWFWRREEIRLNEIDTGKIVSQTLGKLLGIVIIHSTQGKKILTLGLGDSQISEILSAASKQQQIGS